MNIDYLYYKLSIIKNEIDFSKLKEEDARLSSILEKANKSMELIDSIKYLLQDIKKIVKDLSKIDPKVEEEYVSIVLDLKSIINLNDLEVICSKLEDSYNKLIKYMKDLKSLRLKYLEELKSQINLINQKFMIYRKLYIKILNKEIDVNAIEINYDSIEDLLRVREDAINKLKEVHNSAVQDLKLLPNMRESELELLIELLDKGEIKVNKKNLNSILKIIKTLVERGVAVQVRI